MWSCFAVKKRGVKMFYEVFGYFLALMGAIGLCIIVAGVFINIEKLTVVGEILLSVVIGGIIFSFVPKDENLDLENMVSAYIVLTTLVYCSMAMMIAMANMEKKQ